MKPHMKAFKSTQNLTSNKIKSDGGIDKFGFRQRRKGLDAIRKYTRGYDEVEMVGNRETLAASEESYSIKPDISNSLEQIGSNSVTNVLGMSYDRPISLSTPTQAIEMVGNTTTVQMTKVDQASFDSKKTEPSEKVTDYELHELLIKSKSFIRIDGVIYVYIKDGGYYRPLVGEFADIGVRQILSRKMRPLVNRNRIIEIIQWLKSSNEIKALDNLDYLEDFVNFKNGTYDLRKGILLDHSPDHYMINVIDAEYHKNPKKGQHFEKFIKRCCNGDESMELLLSEIFAIIISNVRSLKRAYFFHGKKNSGKSLTLGIATDLVGKAFCSALGLSELNEKFKRGMLAGMHLNVAAEMEESAILRLDIFKMATGNDLLTGEHKFMTPFIFHNRALMLMSGNSLPRINVADAYNAFSDRVVFVPFMTSIPASQRDPELGQKISKEKDAIVSWAIAALMRLRANDYQHTFCEAAEMEKAKFNGSANSMLEFVEEMCILDSNQRIHGEVFYKAYEEFCDSRDYDPLNEHLRRKFLRNKYNLTSDRFWLNGHNLRGLIGIGLLDDAGVASANEEEKHEHESD